MDSFYEIDIRPFNFSEKQDIELWLSRYSWAVIAALPDDATNEMKINAYLKHLPTKLDDLGLKIFETSTNKNNWPALKAELIQKLADPMKKQHFQDNIDALKWDGKLPLHTFEHLVITETRSLHPLVAENQELFKQEIHKRFIAGLPPDYQSFIDLGLPPRTYDIEKARERAEKWQELLQKNEKLPLAAAWTSRPPEVSFTAASMTSMEKLSQKISDMSINKKHQLEAQQETNSSINGLLDEIRMNRKKEQDHYSSSFERSKYDQKFDFSYPKDKNYYTQDHFQSQQPDYHKGYHNSEERYRHNYHGPQDDWSPYSTDHYYNKNRYEEFPDQPYLQDYERGPRRYEHESDSE